MSTLTEIYIINGNFLIFESKDALALRRDRIVGTLIGCPSKNPYQIATSGLPLKLSHYEVDVILDNDLGKFLMLVESPKHSLDTRGLLYSVYLKELEESAQRDYREKRMTELSKRNIPIMNDKLKPLDISKLKVPILNTPSENFSPYETLEISKEDVRRLIGTFSESPKQALYRDLYSRGFYITSGIKFGSEFLAYVGDPLGYHARYAIRLISGDDLGNVDLSNEDFSDLNALYRLCYTAGKISLLATCTIEDSRIHYWSLEHREFLTALSESSTLKRHDPQVSDNTVIQGISQIPNKIMKR